MHISSDPVADGLQKQKATSDSTFVRYYIWWCNRLTKFKFTKIAQEKIGKKQAIVAFDMNINWSS